MTNSPNEKYILIVDDDDEDVFAFRWAMKYSLAHISVMHIDNGTEAIKYLLQGSEKHRLPELVLVDINMPGVDGYDTLAAIRNSINTKHLPVLMFSTSGAPKEVRRSYAEGANAHLVKPNSIEELRQLAASLTDFWLRYVTLPNSYL